MALRKNYSLLTTHYSLLTVNYSLKGIFKNLFILWEFRSLPLPLLEACLADAETHLQRDGEVVEWRAQRCQREWVFARVLYHIEVVRVVLVAVTQDIRESEVVARSHTELELSEDEVETSTSCQTKRESVISLGTEVILATHTLGCEGFVYRVTLIILECRGEVVGECWCCFEIYSQVVFDKVEVWLPNQRHHYGVEFAGVVLVLLLVLVARRVWGIGETSLEQLHIYTYTTYKARQRVVTPRYTRSVCSPYRFHLLRRVGA